MRFLLENKELICYYLLRAIDGDDRMHDMIKSVRVVRVDTLWVREFFFKTFNVP